MAARAIGIAGYMGSGKTTCCRFLAGRERYHTVNGDLEAKELMNRSAAVRERLVADFGKEVVRNGTISFQKLGAIVFGDIEKLRRLNAIIHPLLLERLRKTIFMREGGIVVIDAALLPLWEIDHWFAVRFWIDASFATRLTRLRHSLPETHEEAIRSRMLMQESLLAPPPADRWLSIPNEKEAEEMNAAVFSRIHALIDDC